MLVRKESIMKSNSTDKNKIVRAAKSAERVIIDLQYLTADQARYLIKMFDSPEAYAENFSAIKAITRGLYRLLENTDPPEKSPLLRMFRTVNDIQGGLMLDDMHEHERILQDSGLMPDPWYGFRSKKGAQSC